MHVPRAQFGAIIDPDLSSSALERSSTRDGATRMSIEESRRTLTDKVDRGLGRSEGANLLSVMKANQGAPKWKTANQYCHKHCSTHPIHSPRFIQRFSYRVDFYGETTDHDVMTTNRSIRSTVPSPVRSLTGVPQVSNRTSKSGSDTMSS